MNSKWTANNIPSQAGRRVIVTGANSGIGFYTALELARHGAEIILPARTQAKADDAIARIRREVPNAKLVPEILDLAEQNSVRAFALRIGQRFPGQSLDLLINNAGVMALPTRELTVDGFERQFATNYLGPFTLSALLFAQLKPKPGTRIVTVSSGIASQGKIEFDNLQSERLYKPMFGTYSQSKLADLIFALELQRRLTAAGSPIWSVAAHPGYAITNLKAHQKGFFIRMLSGALSPFFSHQAAHGALPTLFAASDLEAKAGGYYGPNGFQELTGDTAPAKIPPAARDVALAKRLWSETERLTGVAFGVLPVAGSSSVA
jgi:NAD(P)-dependent dehydrogenase (short-subunit alcohol dehydrogenase family)